MELYWTAPLLLDCLASNIDGDVLTNSVNTTPSADLAIGPASGIIWWRSHDNRTDMTTDGDGITNLDEYKGKINPIKSDLAPAGDDDDDDGKDKDAWAANNWLYVLIAVAAILLIVIGILCFMMSRKGKEKEGEHEDEE